MAKDRADDEGRFVRRALIVIALAALALIAWQLRTVLVLLFGAIVMGTIFRAIAEPLSKHLRLPDGVAVLVAVLVIVGALVGVAWLLGQQISAQTDALAQTLPRALTQVDNWLGGFGLSHPFQTWLAQLHHSGGTLVSRFGTWLSTASTGVANFLIVFFGGVFLASEPRFYRTGAMKLIPEEKRGVFSQAMDESERALRLWLKGALLAMMVLGVLTGTGLWLPAHTRHITRMPTGLRMRALFLREDAARAGPDAVTVVAVSPLLRELILAACDEPVMWDEQGPVRHVVALALHEIGHAATRPISVPACRDPRLQRVADALLAKDVGKTFRFFMRKGGPTAEEYAKLPQEQRNLELVHALQSDESMWPGQLVMPKEELQFFIDT